MELLGLKFFDWFYLLLQQIQLNFFDPSSSSTASLVRCSDQRCSLGLNTADSGCSSESNQCSYTFQYGDGSGTSGYYVADFLHLDTILQGSLTTNSTAQIMFGWARNSVKLNIVVFSTMSCCSGIRN